MNAEWHRRHVLPKGAATAQRIAWHREHQETCACRPIPPGLSIEARVAETTAPTKAKARTKTKTKAKARPKPGV